MNTDSRYLKFANNQEVQQLAQKENKALVTFDGYVLDPTTFATHHPGGQDILLKRAGNDITA